MDLEAGRPLEELLGAGGDVLTGVSKSSFEVWSRRGCLFLNALVP